MTHYDIIGDVHGCATKLRALLEAMGYRPDVSGVYRHPERTAVFVGDLIDRGPEQLEVLQLVKAMTDAGSAKIAMGNHEFNAIAWATNHPETGEPLREHSTENGRQHEEFVKQLSDEDQAYYVEWFKTLPLWLDLGDIRVVHACWHPPSMEVVLKATGGTGRLTDLADIVEANRKHSDLYEAVEALLKGPEIPLLEHGMESYYDHEAKKPRDKARIAWWNHDATTLPDLAELRGARLENGEKYPTYDPRDVNHPRYLGYLYSEQVPLFYGHYWRRWEHHRDEWTTYTACVDFSAVKGGTLVAYRWNGEPEIHWRNYVPHDPAVVSPTPSDQTV